MRLITIITNDNFEAAKAAVPGLGAGRAVEKVWDGSSFGRVGNWINPSTDEQIALEGYGETYIQDDDCLLDCVQTILDEHDPALRFSDEE